MTYGKTTAVLTSQDRHRRIRAVLWGVLGLNWSVAILKIVYGLMTRCTVLVTDGVHSLSDGASNIVGLVGISIASHPADSGHPYGHRKFETLASLVISFALFFAALSIFKECIHQLFRPVEPEVNALSFGVSAITLAVNAAVAAWERREGKRLKSELLVADSWHTFSDVFVTLSVFVALAGIAMGWKRLDTIVSIGIALFIAGIATKILLKATDVLADRAVLDEKAIRDAVMTARGVEDCHEIRSRGTEDDVRIDLHVLVDPHMTVEDSHDLANRIESDLKRRFTGVTDVLVHVEPLHHDHGELHGERAKG